MGVEFTNLISVILFSLMGIVVLFLPLRKGLVAYVVMCNIDVPGIANTIKILIIPVILLIRFMIMEKKNRTLEKNWSIETYREKLIISPIYLFWFLFTIYSCLAIWWSESNYIAGLKFSTNLVAIYLFYQVFKRANNHGMINKSFLTLIVSLILILGILQTYLLVPIYGYEFSRFTAFVASQQYAAFLVALLTLVLWENKFTVLVKLSLILLILSGIFLNGSRTWFLGTCVVVVFYILFYMKTNQLRMGILSLILAVNILFLPLLFNYALENEDTLRESNRLAEGFYTLVDKDNSNLNGTIGARDYMNESMIYEIGKGSLSELFFGHGTSSSESVAKKYFPNHYFGEIDANRVAHNEWLRILYEFGILGLILWMVFLLACLIHIIKNSASKIPILSYSVGLLIALTTENVIMGAGNAVLCGLMILLVSSQHRKNKFLNNNLTYS